jgi:AmmeMemoRadiSam system protein A
MSCSPTERRVLLGLAYKSIECGLQTGSAFKPDAKEYPPQLLLTRASFVTLKLDEKLRGCIGTLEAHARLANSVAENAYAAAFRDPRFPGLTTAEFGSVTIELSVLGPLQVIQYHSEADLLTQIRAGRDGWVLQENHARGTFLPSVRDALPDAQQYLKQLKMKAGLTADYWSDNMKVWRYSTESFSADAEEAGQYAVTGVTSG